MYLKFISFKNEVGIDKKVLKQEMMVLPHSSMRKSLHWHLNDGVTDSSVRKSMSSAKVGIFSLSYVVIPSCLVSVLFIDPYLILKFINF